MKKTVLTFGSIAGLIVGSFMFVSMLIMNNTNHEFQYGMLIGYASMLIAFSFIFVGIKSYRDKHLGGNITFGKAFLTGLWITLIASTFYVIIWALEYKFVFPDFMEKYQASMLKSARASGATEEMIAAQTKEMTQMGELYKNPVFFTLMTYVEILPVGLLVTIISALILRKRGATMSANI